MDIEAATPQFQLTSHRRPLDALTGIRIFAAFYVVVFHSTVAPRLMTRGYDHVANFLDCGFEAVSLFFLLSGFILAYTYAGQLNGWPSYRRFWEARFARIWPVYIVSLLLISAVDKFLPTRSYMLATIFMVQAWNPFDPRMAGAWNVVCWTVSCEAFFYFVFPWFQVSVEKIKGNKQIALFCFLLLLTITLNLSRNRYGYLGPPLGSVPVPLPLQRLPEFLAGAILGNYFLIHSRVPAANREAVRSRTINLWTYISFLLAIAVLSQGAGAWSSLSTLAFVGLIYGLATERTVVSRILSTRLVVFGGSISYAVYIYQTSAKDISKLLGAYLGIHSEAALSILMVCLLVVISALSFEVIENPSRRTIRSVFLKMEQKRIAAFQKVQSS